MMSRSARFNFYFLVVAWVLGWASSGCKSPEQRKQAKEASTLRLHLEANPDGSGRTTVVTVGRAGAFQVNAETVPFLDEGRIAQAAVVDDGMGGFQILVQFDRQGAWMLDQYSTAQRGRRVAIFSQFSTGRWIAAPVLTRSLSDGLFAFTPDTTREEAERLVRGLNNVARKLGKRKDKA